MTFYFAWVGPSDTEWHNDFARNDEDIFSFKVEQEEGEFPTLTVEIKNPRVGLLSASRSRWAWLSWQDGSEVVPLFFGRTVGAPEAMEEEILRLVLIARPLDYEGQKDAVADTLRVLPFYDPVWVSEDQRDDPDAVLLARTALWHVDRISHDVSVSDIIVGEEGPEEIGANFYRDSLEVRFVKSPGRQARVSASVAWQQRASGTLDVSAAINAAFTEAGTEYPNLISSYTGEGLGRTWPSVGAFIGGGWSVAASNVERVDGDLTPRIRTEIDIAGNDRAAFPLWHLQQHTELAYDATRDRLEAVEFRMDADLQPLITGGDEDDIIEIFYASSAPGEIIDGEYPIGDLRRRSYFQTDRGEQSIQHLIAVARARLLAQARAVEVIVDVPFETAIGLNCRMSASLADERIPGGECTGKVSFYSFGFNGDEGELRGDVILACSVGAGGEFSGDTAAGTYVADDYVAAGYQSLAGGHATFSTADVAYEHYGEIEVEDDGIDLFNVLAGDMVLSVDVENGQTAQEQLLTETEYEDVYEAVRVLNENPTRVKLDMRPIDGLSFRTEYQITVSDLVVPRTIDLEAAS
jgi:hypothetical protein